MRLRSRLEVGTFIVARGRIAILVWRLFGAAALAMVAGALWFAPVPGFLLWIGAGVGALAAWAAGSSVVWAIQGDEDARLRVSMRGIAVCGSTRQQSHIYPWSQVRRVVLAERLRIGSGDEPMVLAHRVVVHLDGATYSAESFWARSRAGRMMMTTGDLIAHGSYAAGEAYRTAEAIKQASPQHLPVDVQSECVFDGLRTPGRPSHAGAVHG